VKRLILYVILLLGLVTVLTGCGQRYLAEKLFWKANQVARTMPQDPKLITVQDYQKLINAYRKVVERCPLEPLAAQSQFIIAQIYILQEQYSNAKEELVKITQNFSDNPELASQAQFMIGNLYERKGNWDKAISEYEKITDLFPLSSMGLRTPIYVAEYYQRAKLEAEADTAYNKAVKHYRKIINEYSGTSVAGVVKDYLALTYASQGRWNEAVDIWQALLKEYSQSQLGANLLFTIGETYVRQIKDFTKAIGVYEEFVQKNPTSKIIKYAKFQIGRLYFIKEDFIKAKQVFEEIVRDYPKEIELCTNSQLAIASCYEKEGNWDKAVQTYHKLTDDYPNTRAALNVPLFIAQYYLRKNQFQDAEKAFKEAISGYEKIIRENPKTTLAVEAQDLISLAYVSQQKWDKAIDSLRTLVDTYPKDPKASVSLFTIAAIYQRQLHEPKKAIEIYEKFIGQYRGHVLANLARSEIESLQKSTNY
jgi:TolA-binding protein